MEELFKSLSPEMIIWKDHYYMARILLRKESGLFKKVVELANLGNQLEREKARLALQPKQQKIKLHPVTRYNETCQKIASLKD
jgi:hypothetical protein